MISVTAIYYASCMLAFVTIMLFSVHSCFYSKRLRHWMAFYILICHYWTTQAHIILRLGF